MKNQNAVKERAEKVTLMNDSVITRGVYVQEKTKDLKTFGYGKLTSEEVDEKLEEVLNGTYSEVDVIAVLISKDIKPYGK